VAIGPTPTAGIPTNFEELQRWTREVSEPYLERGKPVSDEVWNSLAEAVGGQRGEALAVSLETLLDHNPKPLRI
jgi:hypothetical protein